MAKGKAFVGIDLGGTNMQIGVVDAAGNVIGRARAKTMASQGASKVLSRTFNEITLACEKAGIQPTALGGIGIGAPGTIDPKTGTVVEAVNLRWRKVPLSKLLHERFGCPALVENDVNAAVFGEWRMGAAKDVTDFVGIWLGTGVGGGLVLSNRLYQGKHFTAGEIGHTTLLPNAPFGRRSLEQTCSRTAIVDRLVSLIRQNHASSLSSLVQGDHMQIKSRAVADAYKQGDALTIRVIDEAADFVGMAVANVATLLSISHAVIGGGLTEALGEPFVRRVRKSAREMVFPPALSNIQVLASRLEDDAGLLGAALMARDAVENGVRAEAWEHVESQSRSRPAARRTKRKAAAR